MTDAAYIELERLAAPARHVFLSPHYDDIALSCGGTAGLLAGSGRTPEIVILFGAEPDAGEPLTGFAAMQHAQWSLEATDVIAARRREEATAAAILGATVTYLPFRDAIYRGSAYLDDDQLFGAPVAAEEVLPEQIVASLDIGARPDPVIRFYAPLAVGGHVDHRLGYAAGLLLAGAGWDVWFYEDLPYALFRGATETRLVASAHPLLPATLVDVTATWDAKLRAILAYRSQLAFIFRELGGADPTNLNRRLRAHAMDIGGAVPAERYWRATAAGT